MKLLKRIYGQNNMMHGGRQMWAKHVIENQMVVVVDRKING
jgi:hypothetical protein